MKYNDHLIWISKKISPFSMLPKGTMNSSSSGIVCKIVNWKLIGEGGRELADFGLVTIIFTYSPHRIIRILQSPVGKDHRNITEPYGEGS